MEKKKSKFRRVLQVIGIIAGTIIVLLYLVLPAGMGRCQCLSSLVAGSSPPENSAALRVNFPARV
jgi:hypothetical protein